MSKKFLEWKVTIEQEEAVIRHNAERSRLVQEVLREHELKKKLKNDKKTKSK